MSPRADELKSALNRLADSPDRADALYELAMEIRNSDIQEALRLSQEAHQLSSRLGYRRGLAYSLRALGSCHYFLADFSQSLDRTLESAKLFDELADRDGLFRAFNTIGNIYYRLDDYATALEYHYQSLKLAQLAGDRDGESGNLNNIGLIYHNLEDYPNALECFHKSLEIYQELGHPQDGGNPLMNIGMVRRKQGRHDQAFEFFHQALDAYQQADDKQGQALCLGNLGAAYGAVGQLQRALDCFNQGLALAQELANRFAEVDCRYNIGDILIKQGRAESALPCLRQAQDMAEALGTRELQCRISQAMAQAHRAMGDHQQALIHYQRYHAVEQAVLNRQVEERVKAMQIVHDVEKSKKETELYRLRNDQLATAYRELEKLAGSYQRLSRANHDLLELERLKSEFIANISHELRSPLTAITGYVEFLAAGRCGQLSQSQQNILERVRTNLRRLVRQIMDLLDFTVIEAGKFTVVPAAFDLRELIDEVLANHIPEVERKGLRLEATAPEHLPVMADRERIYQTLENLIINALKFTSRGGITIGAGVADGGRAWVAVSDTGIGIPQDSIPKIFERFQQLDGSSTRRYGGVGLGLAIVKSILEAHGSAIEVESQPEVGTTFRFRLPLATEPDNAAAPARPPEDGRP